MLALNRNVLGYSAAIAGLILVTVALTKGLFSSDMAAWVQAFGAIIAIGAAAYLQDRDRLAQRREAHSDRMKAFLAIVKRCQFTLGNISNEQAGKQSERRLRYWSDETQADIRAIEAISLVEIGDDEALEQIIKLRSAMTTVRRNVYLALERLTDTDTAIRLNVNSQVKQVSEIRLVAEKLCGGADPIQTAVQS